MTDTRPQIDRCPGLTRPFHASDGAIVRIRKPGGIMPMETLRQFASVSRRWGDGNVHLTSRTNLQVRGLPTTDTGAVTDDIADAVRATGLIPSSHELVRNILASPLPAVVRPDNPPRDHMAALVAELDEHLLDTPELEGLPGRFLWAFDDGAGDVAAEPWDLCYQALDTDGGLLATSAGQVWEVARSQVISDMIQIALDFQQVRTALAADQGADPAAPIWHIGDLPVEALDRIGADVDFPSDEELTINGPPALGRYGRDVLAGVPLGLLTPQMLRALSGISEITLTPWRAIYIPGGEARIDDLAEAGFTVDATDPWASISACTGLPHCARSAIDTAALAHDLAAAATTDPTVVTTRVHISGCDRRCGAPHGDHVNLLAPADLDHALAQLQESKDR